jgi:hypothetical protein
MQFAMLLYETAADFESRASEDLDARFAPWRAYYEQLIAAGVYVSGTPLEPDTTGTTLRVHGTQRQVQDGPYADTKEQLGGIIVLELPSLDAALEWAARCPTAATGAIEVRPLAPSIRRIVTGASD